MTKLEKDVKKALKLGHNRIMLYNHYGDAVIIYNAECSSVAGDRLELDDWIYSGWHDALSFDKVKAELGFHDNYNDFIGSWRD
jgi:hypothetical protein